MQMGELCKGRIAVKVYEDACLDTYWQNVRVKHEALHCPCLRTSSLHVLVYTRAVLTQRVHTAVSRWPCLTLSVYFA